jgi:primosomal protein N' (replication factor Y)
MTGRAMIQTMVPEHKVLNLAARQDYDGFYDLEIAMRRMQGVPPFGDLVQITFTGQDETAVLRGAAKFRDSLRACLQDPAYGDCTVLGPAPCPVPKINYNFRYRVTLRSQMDKQKRLLLAHLLKQFSQDKTNRGISAFADVNGND